jgi:hypothetical protein
MLPNKLQSTSGMCEPFSMMIGAAAGAGALVGAGVDAMLERSPSAGLTH